MTDDKEVVGNKEYYAVDTETVLPDSQVPDISVKTVNEDVLVKQLAAKMSQVKKLMDKKKKSSYFEDFDEVLGSEPVDMTKEYNILVVGSSYAAKNKMTGTYTFLSSAVEADQADMLDLKSVKSNIDEHFTYLMLRKRFNAIRATASVSIEYDYDGFHVKDAMFETLDEVEKAIANKAFL